MSSSLELLIHEIAGIKSGAVDPQKEDCEDHHKEHKNAEDLILPVEPAEQIFLCLERGNGNEQRNAHKEDPEIGLRQSEAVDIEIRDRGEDLFYDVHPVGKPHGSSQKSSAHKNAEDLYGLKHAVGKALCIDM